MIEEEFEQTVGKITRKYRSLTAKKLQQLTSEEVGLMALRFKVKIPITELRKHSFPSYQIFFS